VCREHGIHFTLYPIGYVPYAREAVAPITRSRDDGWKHTMFRAVVDAAHDAPAWSRKADGGPGWWTQRRQIARAASAVGLKATTRRAERVAGALDVGLAVHANAVREYAAAPGFRARARAATCILDAVPIDSRTTWRVLGAGWIAGSWPRPWLWDGATYSPFPAPERRAIPA
jgi:hypothetical protein